jgi:hypothetical protein
VLCYGDATGGARGSAKVRGSDWDLVEEELRGVFPGGFRLRVPRANPSERARVNAVNSRLQSGDGTVRMMVDPQHCPHLVKDLEGVQTLKGGSGEIDKRASDELTHISDGTGYYVARVFPVVTEKTRELPIRGF